ncbi:MAG: hypothetical protein ACE5HO_14155, partial [bacterium]
MKNKGSWFMSFELYLSSPEDATISLKYFLKKSAGNGGKDVCSVLLNFPGLVKLRCLEALATRCNRIALNIGNAKGSPVMQEASC